MTREARMLERKLVKVNHAPTPMVGTLECGHQVALHWSMTELSRWRDGYNRVWPMCETCAAIPHPVTNPDPYWKARGGAAPAAVEA